MRKITKHEEQQKVEVIDKEEDFCDLCGDEITRSYYSRDSFRIKLSTGSAYPEGGHVDTEHAYFCESCAEKVKSALIGIGVVFERTEDDW